MPSKQDLALPMKKSLLNSVAERFQMEPSRFMDVIRGTIFQTKRGEPQATTEEIAAFLSVANDLQLSPFAGEIYAFRKKSGGIQTIVGYDGFVAIANRHEQYNGNEFEYDFDDNGKLKAVTAIIYRKDRDHPTRITEWMDECKGDSVPWRRFEKRMLRNKAFNQGVRAAFSISGICDPDEAERIKAVEAEVVEDAEAAAELAFSQAPKSLPEPADGDGFKNAGTGGEPKRKKIDQCSECGGAAFEEIHEGHYAGKLFCLCCEGYVDPITKTLVDGQNTPVDPESPPQGESEPSDDPPCASDHDAQWKDGYSQCMSCGKDLRPNPLAIPDGAVHANSPLPSPEPEPPSGQKQLTDDHPTKKRLTALSRKFDISPEIRKTYLFARYGVKQYSKLTVDQGEEMILILQILGWAKDNKVSDEILNAEMMDLYGDHARLDQLTMPELAGLKNHLVKA